MDRPSGVVIGGRMYDAGVKRQHRGGGPNMVSLVRAELPYDPATFKSFAILLTKVDFDTQSMGASTHADEKYVITLPLT